VTNPFDLCGRTALVTGAGRGIGAAVASCLDQAGARVALVARTEADLRQVAAPLEHDPVVVPADLATVDGPAAVAEAVMAAFDGRLDILVNNAAGVLRKDTGDLTVEEMDQLWAVNVRSVLLLCAALVPAMAARGRGSVINFSSVSGVIGTPRRAAYAATKAALDGMTRSLAMEFGPRGVRVNSVAPGVVQTDMWQQPLRLEGVADGLIAQTALRRLGEPDDIAPVVLFLASDASAYMTGEVLSVDGGMRATRNLHPPV
jgi:NAD(P)-dependent dehydrogenase (short-subunit alcohol dehydrogenase family)